MTELVCSLIVLDLTFWHSESFTIHQATRYNVELVVIIHYSRLGPGVQRCGLTKFGFSFWRRSESQWLTALFCRLFRGCPVAQVSKMTSYIAYPSINMKELADTAKLSQLNQNFLALVAKRQIKCKNFMEGSKTQVPANLKFFIVPPVYAG